MTATPAVARHAPTIALSEIRIAPDRQRQEFDENYIQELADSFGSVGQLQPIVTRTEDGERILVCGENRIKAAELRHLLEEPFTYLGQIVPANHIGFIDIGELDEIAREEAELDENLKRRDLTFVERAKAIEKLHKLRIKQKAAENEKLLAEGVPAAALSPHRVMDTALEVHNAHGGSYTSDISQALIVARNADNPVIKTAKTQKEAIKLLIRAESQAKNAELAKSVGATFSSADHLVVNRNCLDFMRECEPEQFDCILTDPPYGMNAHEFSDAAGKLLDIDHQYRDDPEHFRELLSTFAPLSFRIAKPQAHLYLFCDIDHFFWLRDTFAAAGWYVFRTPLINYKPGSGRVPLPDHGPRRQYETILYAIKGKRNTLRLASDVITSESDDNLGHGAQKPVGLYRDLLTRSVRPGDKVFDGFAGTGTIFPAAHECKVIAVGCEMAPQYYGICLQRIEGLDG